MTAPVLLCLAADDAASAAEAVALRLAVATDAPIHAVHVADPEPDFVGYDVGPKSVRDAVASELRGEHRWLERAARRLADAGADADFRLLRGATVGAILAEAERIGAGWIVVGTHERSVITEALLGSVSHELLRHADRPVVLVPRTALRDDPRA